MQIPLKVLRTALFVVVLSSLSFGQSKTERLDELIGGFTRLRQFNGTALIAKEGKVLLKKGYGFANFELGSPTEVDTKYRLASVTKQFTAMRIMQLVEEGKLNLAGTISDYLPDYPRSTGSRITIHHLLTHTSGIPSYTDFPGFMQRNARNPVRPQEFIKFFADSALQFEPGTKFHYNNSAYFLLGVLIEKVTGMSYAENINEHIFKPLGMKNSGYDRNAQLLPKRAAGYQQNGSQLMNAQYIDMTIPYSAGSLYSTVEDLYVWDQALYTHTLLPSDAAQKLFSKYVWTDEGAQSRYYGYGWFMNTVQIGNSTDSVESVEHGGGIFGFNTLMFRVPKEKITIILLSNLSGVRLRDITKGALGILLNKPYDKAKESLALRLQKELASGPLEKAFANFRANKEKPSLFYQSEGELNDVGYAFLGEGKIQEAIEVFKLAVELFPGSSNAYDSLGEGYMKSGDKENAIKNYQRSVELDPNNDNGREMLKKLSGT
ncbi:MAG: serine hydrolase [Bacteroidota bacterium]